MFNRICVCLWLKRLIRLAIGHRNGVSVGMFDGVEMLMLRIVSLMLRYALHHSCLICVVVSYC